MKNILEITVLKRIMNRFFQFTMTILAIFMLWYLWFGEDWLKSLPRQDPPELTACYDAISSDEYVSTLSEINKWYSIHGGAPNSQLSAEDRAERKHLSTKLDRMNTERDFQRDKCLEQYDHATWQALKEIEAEYEI